MASIHLADQKCAFPLKYAHAYILAHTTCMCAVFWGIFFLVLLKNVVLDLVVLFYVH